MITIGNPRHPLSMPAGDTPADAEKRQRALATRALFGGKAATGLDFSKPDALPAITNPGGTDLVDFSTLRREEVRQSTAARLDRLPAEVQRVTRDHPHLRVEHLEVLAAVVRSSKRLRGEAAPLSTSDMAKTLGVTVERAAVLVEDLTRSGLIRRVPTSAVLPYFMPSI